MLRQFWNAVLRRRRKTVVYVPDSDQLPALWPRQSIDHPQPNLSVLSATSTQVLTTLCDSYWNSFLNECEDDVVIIRDSTVCRRSLDILGERGSEALGWARERLKHPGYDAREDGACLLGVLAAKGALGSEEQAVAAELALLVTRPWKEDPKELQANTAAMAALHMIGGDRCLATMRHVLASPEWDNSDIQWDAACILSDATGQHFMETSNPIQAAKDWSRSNP